MTLRPFIIWHYGDDDRACMRIRPRVRAATRNASALSSCSPSACATTRNLPLDLPEFLSALNHCFVFTIGASRNFVNELPNTRHCQRRQVKKHGNRAD